MSMQEQFDQALHAGEPLWELREVVQGLLVRGHGQAELLVQLEQFRAVLRAAGRDEDEDIVLEIMDFITGWCSPQMAL